jgi:hypothetical protein
LGARPCGRENAAGVGRESGLVPVATPRSGVVGAAFARERTREASPTFARQYARSVGGEHS